MCLLRVITRRAADPVKTGTARAQALVETVAQSMLSQSCHNLADWPGFLSSQTHKWEMKDTDMRTALNRKINGWCGSRRWLNSRQRVSTIAPPEERRGRPY